MLLGIIKKLIFEFLLQIFKSVESATNVSVNFKENIQNNDNNRKCSGFLKFVASNQLHSSLKFKNLIQNLKSVYLTQYLHHTFLPKIQI